MATSPQPASLSDEGLYRSFKELRDDPTVAVVFSPAAKRLFWPLDGVFPTALSVMKTPRSADDLEPYFQHTLGGDIWHEIAQLPLTEPKVSSVEASVWDLEQWESNWAAWHGRHEGEPANPEYVTYGDLSDEDRPYATEAKEDGSWEEDSDTEFLIRCCGQDRPLGKRGQKLVVTPAAGGHFVTVHDYVSDGCQASALSWVGVSGVDGGQGAGAQGGGEAELDSSARGWPGPSYPCLDCRDSRKDTRESKQVIFVSIFCHLPIVRSITVPVVLRRREGVEGGAPVGEHGRHELERGPGYRFCPQ
ncbi:hypothetical protein RB595_004716 [Gaeumannomyces hyphopodioides]